MGNDWSPIAKPQPEIGQFWLHLEEKVRGTVPKVKVAYRPHICMHCDDAPCIEACPIEGAAYKREDGLVILDTQKCTGCRLCVAACPYDAIFFNEDLNLAQKCTGCAHLIDDGWAEPRCADACPTEALKMMDEDEAKELIAKGQAYAPKFGGDTKPRVYYIGLPKKFIAGTLYEPVEEEVVIGADRDPQVRGRQGAHHRDRRLRRLLVRRHRRRRVLPGAQVRRQESSRSPTWTPRKQTSTSETSRWCKLTISGRFHAPRGGFTPPRGVPVI